MGDVEVLVFDRGIQIGRIARPLRSLDGKPAVTYRGELRPLVEGNRIYLDGRAPVCAVRQPCPAEPGNPASDLVEDEAPAADETDWDAEQLRIIGAEPCARLLVSAGPGTGKTSVACARVAELINQHDVTPSRIWLISFTRTAVREIADRIASYLDEPGSAFAVKIATLDSRAWAIHSGFDEEAKLLGDYEENISRVIELIQQNADAQEYLEQVEHLIVDEAQDVVGVRADLVLQIIERLSAQCGLTVFADEAQAIYGFTNDEDQTPETTRQSSLVERLRHKYGTAIPTVELVKVHRTSSPQLLEIFSETRRLLLDAGLTGEQRLASVTSDVWRLAHGQVPDVTKQDLADRENLFVLFRRRSDVLMASSYLEKMPHRIRMSGAPVCLEPWVGAILHDHMDPDIDSSRFMSLWQSRVAPAALASRSAEEAWAQLARLAGRSAAVVDVRRLRRQLGRSRPDPEFCSPELGMKGPIIGTIHASKGRETDHVHLMLPGSPGDDTDMDEEARVIFVAATRGRKQLKIGQGYKGGASRIEPSGRVYRIIRRDDMPKAQVEIGRDGDIQAEGIAGRKYYRDPGEVRKNQERIARLHGNITDAEVACDRASGFAYRLNPELESSCIAVLDNIVNADLFKIATVIRERHGGPLRRPPDRIQHLRILGIRTIVLPPDAAEAERLYGPWNATGIMLAPIVLGYTTFYLPARKGRGHA